MEPNRVYEIPLTFYNNSGTTLGSKAQSGFSVGNHWCDAGGTVVQWLDGLRPLMHPLEPGNHVDLTLWVRSPHKEGIYQLEIDLEHAGSFWLSELGVKRRFVQHHCVITTKLYRFGRKATDVSTTVAKLEKIGIRVHIVAFGGVDLTISAGKMTMNVINAVAQFERDLLIERAFVPLQVLV